MKAPVRPIEADAVDKKQSALPGTIRQPDPSSLLQDSQHSDWFFWPPFPWRRGSCSARPATDLHCHGVRAPSAFSPRLVSASTALKGHEGFLPLSSVPSHRGLFLRTPAIVPRYPAEPS